MPINTHDERETLLVSVDFEDVVAGNIEADYDLEIFYGDDSLPQEIWPAGRTTYEGRFVFKRVTVRSCHPTLWECLRMWWSMRKRFTRKKEA